MDVDGAETNQGGHGNMASHSRASCLVPQDPPRAVQVHPPASTTVKNRRRRYLDIHPEYFGSGLELSGIPRRITSLLFPICSRVSQVLAWVLVYAMYVSCG